MEWGRHNQSWVHLFQANELIGGRAWFFQACLAPKFILFPLLLFSQSVLKQCSLGDSALASVGPKSEVRDFVKLGLSWVPTSSFMKRWQGCERAFGETGFFACDMRTLTSLGNLLNIPITWESTKHSDFQAPSKENNKTSRWFVCTIDVWEAMVLRTCLKPPHIYQMLKICYPKSKMLFFFSFSRWWN